MSKIIGLILVGFLLHKGVSYTCDYVWHYEYNKCLEEEHGNFKNLGERFECVNKKLGALKYLEYAAGYPSIGFNNQWDWMMP